MNEELSPKLIQKIVYLGATLRSFPQAQQAAEALLELRLTSKRIERLTERIGTERVKDRDQQVASWKGLPLVEKLSAPAGVKTPTAVAISSDGGRMQRCDVPSENDSHWREYKGGTLMELKAVEHDGDPWPEIPEFFLNQDRMETLAREIGQLAALPPDPPVAPVSESIGVCSPKATPEEQYEPPQVLSRDVCATLSNSETFGRQLAAMAWQLGFAAARLKAFVADGLAWNWTIWERHFKHLRFVPILDFIHALTHVFAAALAGRSRAEGMPIYARWITWVWQGEVLKVITELAERQRELGTPPPECSETEPRKIVSDTLTYLQNQQSRMNYPEYRRQGLPITSSHMESTIKQLNARIKGTEKFWSVRGGEAVIQLRADLICDSQPLFGFWADRDETATGTRTYRQAA